MAEALPVQCTERTNFTDNDLLTLVAGRHLSQNALISYMEALQQKVHRLEQTVDDKDDELRDLGVLLGNREGGELASVDAGVCGGCGNTSCDSRTDQDLVQRLLLKCANFQNENKELREMYEKCTKDQDVLKHLARQCLQTQEKNKLLEQELLWTKTLFGQKEREYEIAQKKLKEIQHFQMLMKTTGTRSTLDALTTGFADYALVQDLEDSSSIRLGGQTPWSSSPPLKRGRFTMQRTYLYECRKCNSFFETKEDAVKVPCCYHSKGFVPAHLRRGGNDADDPMEYSNVFWPCCQQLGKNATKCVLNGTHRFN